MSEAIKGLQPEQEPLLTALKQGDTSRVDALLPDWLAAFRRLPSSHCPPVELDQVVAHLEQEVGKQQWADMAEAIRLAQLIIDLGQRLEHLPYLALGKML
ncbi:MAG: hypothetical protein KDE28_18100, partial [Anaerolineales bacterium]|nr:hypothetical protein [Anaerolineales bacterium]